MLYLTNNSSINELPLSVRASNCLKRAGALTISDMLNLTEAQLFQIPNMGRKTVDEIIEMQKAVLESRDIVIIDTIPEECIPKGDSVAPGDIPITKLGLSVRSVNALQNAGITTQAELYAMSESRLLQLKNLGVKSVAEIRKYLRDNACGYIEKGKTDLLVVEGLKEISVCLNIPMETLTLEYSRLEAQHTGHSFEVLRELLFGCESIGNALKAMIINSLESRSGRISRVQLGRILPQYLDNTTIIENTLIILEQEHMVNLLGYGEIADFIIERTYPSVFHYAQELSNSKLREVLLERLSGKTLDEIGVAKGITRERVRQLVVKALEHRPRLREDDYCYFYCSYSFSDDEFASIFNEPVGVIQYLESVYKKKKTSPKNLALALTDDLLSVEWKRSIERVVYRHYITIGRKRYPKTRQGIMTYALSLFACKGISLDEFYQHYNELVSQLGLADDPTFIYDKRTMENWLARSGLVLWSMNHRFRAYDISEREYETLLDRLNFEQYSDIELSTLAFFRDYPDLMQEYDIRNEYELHSLLRYLCQDPSKYSIEFGKMPTIRFGRPDRDGQVLDILLQYAPTTAQGLAEAYEARYGVRATTVMANYFNEITEYYHDGMYTIDADNLPFEQYERMKAILSEDFYMISDVERLYISEYPYSDRKSINPYTLKTLGFMVFSNYIIRDTYKSAKEYFEQLMTTADIVNTREFSRDMKYIVMFNSTVYRLCASYEIIEFEPGQYINMRRLSAAGTTVEQIRSFCNAVWQNVGPNVYFTIYSLRKNGFSHSLEELFFGDWFYSSVLSQESSRFSFRRLGGTRLLYSGEKNVLFKEFLEYIVEKEQKIELYDLLQLLSDEYDIHSDREHILQDVRASNLYYDDIMDTVYIDYDTYFEEV